MLNPNNAKKPGKEVDAAMVQKLRHQLTNKVVALSDEELEQVAGGINLLHVETWHNPIPTVLLNTVGVPDVNL